MCSRWQMQKRKPLACRLRQRRLVARALQIRRNIRWPQAERLIARIHAAFGVMRRPAGRVLKQSNGANPLIRAEIEPVMGAARHADHWFKDRKSTRLNSSHANISYAVFCLKKKKKKR